MNKEASPHFFVDRFWASPVGTALLSSQQVALSHYISTLSGYNCIELSVKSTPFMMLDAKIETPSGNGFGHCVYMRDSASRLSTAKSISSSLIADFQAFPIAPDCVDNIILHHALEFSNDSHQLLREADSTLKNGGHVVIFGFNPFSLWALYRLGFQRNGPQQSKNEQFIRCGRVLDWLSLLNYDIVQRHTDFFYMPSQSVTGFASQPIWRKLSKPVRQCLGMYYIIVAKKRSITLTANRVQWRHGLQPNVSIGLQSLNNLSDSVDR